MSAETSAGAATNPKTAEAEMMAARQAALQLLEAVLEQKQALDNALEDNPRFGSLPVRDRAFVRMLVATSLRRLGQIDDLIDKALDRPGSLKNHGLRNILRLGVTQIVFMEVPDHACVDTSVRLVESAGMDGQKGFVNGVLRNITRTYRELVSRQDEARINTPEWLLKIWIADYDLRLAAEIATANLAEAPLDITVKDPASKNYWGSALKASELSTGTLRRVSSGRGGGGAVHEMEGFDQGAWWVQDAAAALPAQLFGPLEGQHVIDLCAAPGGKTAQLASMGAHVIAVDRSAQRLKRLEENLARLGLESHVEVLALDATQWRPEEAPQRILLDAPCTSTGTIRRHPDILHLKAPQDMTTLVGTQGRLLSHAAKILGVGGVLVYCTCSLQRAEGEDQVETLLAARSDMQRVPIAPEEIGDYAELIDANGDLRILPFHLAPHGGMDGFYIARLAKIG